MTGHLTYGALNLLRWTVRFLPLILAIAAAAIVPGLTLAYTLSLLLFLFICVIIHEAGHAIFGAIAGIPLGSFNIGEDRPLFSFPVGSARFAFSTSFLSGFVTPRRITGNWLRVRLLVFVAGGVIAQLLSLAVYFVLIDMPAYGSVPWPLTFGGAYIIACSWSVLVNLFLHGDTAGVLSSSRDVTELGRLIFRGQSAVERWLDIGSALEGAERLRQQRFTEAEESLRAALASRPGAVPSGLLLVSALARQGKLAEARQMLDGVSAPLSSPWHKQYLAARTYLALLDPDEAALRQAEADSAGTLSAYRRSPHHLALRGAVLAERGKVRDSLRYLEASLRNRWAGYAYSGDDNVLGMLYAAYAHHLSGDTAMRDRRLRMLDSLGRERSPDEDLLYRKLAERTGNFGREP